jgi:hypothetical protein
LFPLYHIKYKKKLVFIFLKINAKKVQNAQKENKSEQALQVIGHVVAEFYANSVQWA